jgi:hypothetical protein
MGIGIVGQIHIKIAIGICANGQPIVWGQIEML